MMKGLLLSFVCLVAIYCTCSNAISLDQALKAQFLTYWTNLQQNDKNAYNTIMGANQHDQLTVFAYTEAVVAANYSYLIVEGAFSNLYEPLALRTLVDLTTDSTNNANNHQVLAFTQIEKNLYINDYVSNKGSLVTSKQIQCENGVIIQIDQSTNHLAPPTNSIMDQLTVQTSSSFTFSTLKTLLNVGGISPYINFNTSKTVFAPSDDVFKALFASNPILEPYFTSGFNQTNTLSNLKSILGTHIVPAPIYATDVTTPLDVANEAGTALILTAPTMWNTSTMTVTVNNTQATAKVTQANILTDGGVIHAIDTVFIPSDFNLPLTEVFVTLNATKFASVVTTKGLQAYLSETANYTIFVPVDSAFNGVDPTVDNLLYHFVPMLDLSFNNGVVESVANSSVETFGKQRLFLTNIGNVNYVNGIRVTTLMPYKSSRGTQVYIIDNVIPFPSLLNNTLSSNSTFRNLLDDGHINGNSAFYNLNQANTTVFVPTDAAFDALLPGIVGYWSLNNSEATSSVVSVLNNHVISGTAVYSFPEGTTNYTSADKENLEVVKTGNTTRVNVASRVNEGPIITSGGTAFTVDQVLLPVGYSLTAHQTLEGFSGYDKSSPYGTYETFLRFMKQAELEGILTDDADSVVTIFAPTDDAFANTENADNYENSTDILKAILYNHVSLTNVGLGLNSTGMIIPVGGNNSGVPDYIKVTQDGEKPEIELFKAGASSGTAKVILETKGRQAVIYGIDRVLGVNQKSSGSSSGLKTWQIIAIAVGGGLLGLLLLAVLIGAVYYLVLRPKSGYRKIN